MNECVILIKLYFPSLLPALHGGALALQPDIDRGRPRSQINQLEPECLPPGKMLPNLRGING